MVKTLAAIGTMMTFDHEAELMKVATAHPKAKLVLQIATDDFKAVCCLSVKFGATLKSSRLLLGVSFHAGSGCTNPETFVQTISDTCCIFDKGADVGFNMYLLDISGGFPGSEDVKLKFEEIISVINLALDKYFPSDSVLRIIVEPSRYYIALAWMLTEQTGSDDEDESSEQTFMYYVNDEVYGSFNCILYDHAHMKPLMQKRPKPICDLPKMHVSDWMLFENMSAYTVAIASIFKRLQRPTIYYVMLGPTWQLMHPMSGSLLGACFPSACVSASLSLSLMNK
ncbi:unnamed protein product [Nyctereutes procyonoides]|uniref:Ornithine decarboxylase n=1 Tax=Nyctereutes procyonoides TaxID=34880 RepID=A0A811YM93_NYCPR|nr:unnamed protein product [Nyctereutes procyonoides]